MFLAHSSLFLAGVFLHWVLSILAVAKASDAHDKLLDTIFRKRKYNPNTRPVENYSNIVHVTMGLAIRQIIEVEEIKERLIASIWRKQNWYDYRLKWNSSDYGGVDSLRVPPSMIWVPDVVLYNSVELDRHEKDAFMVFVSNDGHCSSYPLEISITQCTIDISDFPFDDQRCVFEFESWSYDIAQLNLTMDAHTVEHGVDTRWLKRSTAWEVLGSPAENTLKLYEGASNPNSVLKFTVNLRRKVLFYIVNLIVPCALIASLTCLAFLLPIGDRIGLGLTTLLALSVYQIIILERIPASSDGIPLIGIFFITQISVNAVAIIMMVFTAKLHEKGEKEESHLISAAVEGQRSCKNILACCWRRLTRDVVETSVPLNVVKSRTGQLQTSKAVTSPFLLNNLKPDKDHCIQDRILSFSQFIHLARVLEAFLNHSDLPAPSSFPSSSRGEMEEAVMKVVVPEETAVRHGPQSEDGRCCARDWKLVATRLEYVCCVMYTSTQVLLLFFLMSYAGRK